MNGDIEITAWRPERRFGWAVRIWRRDWISSNVEALHFHADGTEFWQVVEPNVDHPPTLYIDDNVWDALIKFFAPKTPQPDPDATRLLSTSLSDQIGVRDRLMTMVEQVISRGENN